MNNEKNEFTTTRNILDIIEFDKNNQLWRVCDTPSELFNYSDVKKVSIIEKIKNHEKTKNIIRNIGSTMIASTSYISSSADVKIQIKVDLTNGGDIVFDISKKYIQQNTLDYHSDKRKAEEVKEKLKFLEKRNKKR